MSGHDEERAHVGVARAVLNVTFMGRIAWKDGDVVLYTVMVCTPERPVMI